MRSSTKIAIGFVVLLLVGYFGYNGISAALIDNEVFTKLSPGRVNLVGIDAGAGYRILVSNQMAQLVESSTTGEDSDLQVADDQESQEDGPKRRIPLKEMLKVLQGDAVALGRLVTAMNDELRSVELPPNLEELSWTPEEIKKALDGDKALEAKLVRRLNMKLDGTPAEWVSVSAIFDGIFLKLPITLNVPVAGTPTPITGTIYMPYKPNFVGQLEMKIGERADDQAFVRGTYQQMRQSLASGEIGKEDIRKSLLSRIDPAATAKFAANPARILSKATVVVNETLMQSAEVKKVAMSDGKVYHDLNIIVSDEGRKRLWQYSRRNRGNQLLLISDGAAIAAPRIRYDIVTSDVAIKQLPDEELAMETADLIQSLAKERK